MVHVQLSALSSYVSGLLSTGRAVFTAEEAEQALGVGRAIVRRVPELDE